MDAQAATADTSAKIRPVSPLNGQPVPIPPRDARRNTRVAKTIREAIEYACRPGACHPKGLAGWLIDRANGGVADRQIFAGMVAKVLPAQIAAQGAGTVVVNLGWLQGRDLGTNVTLTAQPERNSLILQSDNRVAIPNDAELTETDHQADNADPLPPFNRQEGGG